MDPSRRYPLEPESVSAAGITHDVWFGPRAGPGVLLLHELSGLSHGTADFADLLMDAGFSVAMPHLFGPVGGPGDEGMAAGFAGLMRRCIAREMSFFLRDHPPRGTAWLGEAARVLSTRSDSPHGVAVVGMCATGAFAMASVFDPHVGAVVASQAALPAFRRGSWGIRGGDDALADADTPVMALRFCRDPGSGKGRVTRLPTLMGETLEYTSRGPTDATPDHADRGIRVGTGGRLHVVWAGGSGHSVLTAERVDLAVDAVVAFLHQNLGPRPAEPAAP